MLNDISIYLLPGVTPGNWNTLVPNKFYFRSSPVRFITGLFVQKPAHSAHRYQNVSTIVKHAFNLPEHVTI